MAIEDADGARRIDRARELLRPAARCRRCPRGSRSSVLAFGERAGAGDRRTRSTRHGPAERSGRRAAPPSASGIAAAPSPASCCSRTAATPATAASGRRQRIPAGVRRRHRGTDDRQATARCSASPRPKRCWTTRASISAVSAVSHGHGTEPIRAPAARERPPARSAPRCRPPRTACRSARCFTVAPGTRRADACTRLRFPRPPASSCPRTTRAACWCSRRPARVASCWWRGLPASSTAS